MPIESGKNRTGGQLFAQRESKDITIDDHFTYDNAFRKPSNFDGKAYDRSFATKDHNDHFIYDANDPNLCNILKYQVDSKGNKIPIEAGSATPVNPFDDKTKDDIIKYGMGEYERINAVNNTGDKDVLPPVSPLYPFMRSNHESARNSNLTMYNRTKTPMMDLEFRKAFNHTFFTRPECYIMSRDDSLTLRMSEQCEHDADFSSSYSRFPHLLKLLSPIYITGSFSKNSINSNWNYLLSNRCMGISSGIKTSISVSDNMVKTTTGDTIIPGKILESNKAGTLSVKFRDDKSLEVYEFFRLWMIYINNIKRGIFAPSYNGYKYKNGFLDVKAPVTVGQNANNAIILHPYDRALDYCCSLFDVYTNEADSKIIFWNKYYGLYPIEANLSGLKSENGSAITGEITCEVTFQYQKVLSNRNMSLVEFNYNAGITDNMGRVNKDTIETCLPFLVRDDPTQLLLKQYIGAANMFTGSPFIILKETQKDPLDESSILIEPQLMFMSVSDTKANDQMNMSITSNCKYSGDYVIGTK